ncbi:hypothetical protein [Flavobacterium sp.]|uniref:hypothetical protein n=1 Tax=Flavobacterium sp. TaxID=239 RepID=UPI00404872C8
MKKYIIIVAFFTVLSSFNKTESEISPFLFQNWIYENYQNGDQSFISKDRFQKDKSGIAFKENGTIVKRQNSGWCGTPPIDYVNVNGTWKEISESLLEIQYESWNGRNVDTIQIVEISKNKLVLRHIYTIKKKD